MAVVLKIVFQGQTHRVPFRYVPDYTAYSAALQDSLPTGRAYTVKYVDDEGDLCTLVESTYSDFVTTAKDAPSGQAVLRVEVLPVPGAVPTDAVPSGTKSLHVRKAPIRWQQAAPKPAWEDDKRDLEELLQQFEQSPRASKKNRKKNKKRSKVTIDYQAVCGLPDKEIEEEEEVEQDASLAHQMSMDSAELAESKPSDVAVVDHGHTGATSNVSGKLAQDLCGMAAAAMDDSQSQDLFDSSPDSADAQDAARQILPVKELTTEDLWEASAAARLRRTSSCPCFSEMNAEDKVQGSLVAQAWPFVDTDKLSVDLRDPLSTSGLIAPQRDTLPPQDTNIPSALEVVAPTSTSPPPCANAYQQVVWMPVVVNWPSSHLAPHMSYAGSPFALVDSAIPAVG